MSDQLFDFAESDEKTGFRLQTLEVYNWGTFHRRVWNLELGGQNTLLTGDIGSGKSTLVDALTTLLVPPQKITYNKAAGAEARERNLRSYILGYYKSERSDEGVGTKAVALRDPGHFSVLLARFHNEGFELNLTLAQVFWIKDPQAPPARLYVVADAPLTITNNFSNFGSEIGDLRKRLRTTPGVELFDAYAPYAASFRRRFGIENDQALDLLNQTISMKSVGNLTDFVRTHMLEPFDPQPRIEALIGHFGDLNQAHKAVLKAKEQIATLEPVAQDGLQYQKGQLSIENMITAREALRPWFASLKVGLLEGRLKNFEAEQNRLLQRRESQRETRVSLGSRRDEIRQAMSQSGADRLETLRLQKKAQESEAQRRQAKAQRLETLLQSQNLSAPRNPEDFGNLTTQLRELGQGYRAQEAKLQERRLEQELTFHQLKATLAELNHELEGLRRRPTNLPEAQVELRRRLCRDLHLDEETLPFSGELLEVRDEEKTWAGAVERVLRNFSLSLLVPEAHYEAVTGWVDHTQLGQKLVYFRVKDTVTTMKAELHPQSLVRKLQIKPGTPFRDWLEAELSRRFDLACTSRLEDFRRERQALTPAGQIKGAGERHEKDDRFRVDDRSRWVLGWSNAQKIHFWEQEKLRLEKQAGEAGSRLGVVLAEITQLQDHLRNLALAGEFQDWLEVDWGTPTREVQRIADEIQELEQASEVLKTLRRQLDETEAEIATVEKALEALQSDLGRVAEKLSSSTKLLEENRALVLPLTEALQQQLETYLTFLLKGTKLTFEGCETRENEVRDELQRRIDNEKRALDRLVERIIKAMTRFRELWPGETRELDASLEALGAWNQLLTQLKGDDLPRFEQHFKRLLNENTIREVANFQSVLTRDRQSIKDKIEKINQSLLQIDYNPGRFIQLEMVATPDAEVRQFYQDLRSCTEGSLTGGGDPYSEAKFLLVKELIEKLAGREGSTDADRRWAQKVTDVRQAFVFSASERFRETGEEHEHYSDSSGKSGGQKEKLAYTVLAAALAYQFGLEWNAIKSRSFRFVVIDEAFGRGSDESTQYGLRLFQKLRLQLLIVTPLQKIHVIEPYIAGVGFVQNHEGRDSMIRNLTIETYRQERDQRTGD